MDPQCGLGVNWSYKNTVVERWGIVVLFGNGKLHAISPDLDAPLVKLHLAKQYCVPLCGLNKPKTSILLVVTNGLYSADERRGTYREVRPLHCHWTHVICKVKCRSTSCVK